jgi:hypothetical protein
VCSKCLNSNHLLHPVVPVNSLENLDFTKSLASEIEGALKDIRSREAQNKSTITSNLVKHKRSLRNHIVFIRESLRLEFDEFFNHLLSSIREDWNLFNI